MGIQPLQNTSAISDGDWYLVHTAINNGDLFVGTAPVRIEWAVNPTTPAAGMSGISWPAKTPLTLKLDAGSKLYVRQDFNMLGSWKMAFQVRTNV